MRIVNLLEQGLNYQNSLGAFSIERVVHGEQEIDQALPHLRFLVSLSPLELAVDGVQGSPFTVPERSAVKVHPNTAIQVNAQSGSEIYVTHFLQDEQVFLETLQREHAEFFENLPDNPDPNKSVKFQWDLVKNHVLDYVAPGEKNAELMLVREGRVLIAPPHSKFGGSYKPTGWVFMYARSSRAFSIAADVCFRVREKEAAHKHLITVEPYLCMAGELEVTINDTSYVVGKNHVILTEPGDVHAITAVRDLPYIGSTMQFPSIPGDKYAPDGHRL